jgi:hypothetical protein
MNPDKRALAEFDRQRELDKLRLEASTEEYQTWYKEREILLENLKKRGENLYHKMAVMHRTIPHTEWLSMGPMEGRDDIELFIQAHASSLGSLDVDLKLVGIPDSSVDVSRENYMQFYPAIIEDYDNFEITPDSNLLDDAYEIVEKIELNLGIQVQEQKQELNEST